MSLSCTDPLLCIFFCPFMPTAKAGELRGTLGSKLSRGYLMTSYTRAGALGGTWREICHTSECGRTAGLAGCLLGRTHACPSHQALLPSVLEPWEPHVLAAWGRTDGCIFISFPLHMYFYLPPDTFNLISTFSKASAKGANLTSLRHSCVHSEGWC